MVGRAGRVSLHDPQRGSTSGLVFGTFDKSDIPGELPDDNERFGEILVAGDLDLDGLDDLLVGLPREGTGNDGALFFYTHAERTGRGFRLGELTTEALIAAGACLGRALGVPGSTLLTERSSSKRWCFPTRNRLRKTGDTPETGTRRCACSTAGSRSTPR